MCKEMVELLSQIAADAGAWVFGTLEFCEVLDALPDMPGVPFTEMSPDLSSLGCFCLFDATFKL